MTTIKDSFELNASARFGSLTFGYSGTYAYLSFPENIPLPRIEATGTLAGQGGLSRGKLLINKTGGDQLIDANLTADRIELTGGGNKRVKTPTLFSPADPGNLLVDTGTTLITQSDPISSQISVWGNITNRGTIRDRTSGSNPALKVYVSGHLLNENSWINSNTYALWPSLSGATSYQFEITNDPNTWANPITTSGTTRNITSYLVGRHDKLTPWRHEN